MDWALISSVVAAIASSVGLLVMGRQLEIARNSFGGRGIQLAAHEAVGASDVYLMKVSLVGPGVRHCVALSLLGAEAPLRPDERPAMDCNSEALSWLFGLDREHAEKAFCMVTWVDAMGDGVRTGAICASLIGDEIFEWKWFRTYGFRRWLQRQSNQPARLGKWVQTSHGTLLDGQGPRDHMPPREQVRRNSTRPRWVPPQLPS